MKICINLLFMRRAKDPIKTIIGQLIDRKKGTPQWLQSAEIFLEVYKDWERIFSFEDEDMKKSIQELKSIKELDKAIIIRRFPLISPNERGRKSESGKRNRSASLS
jgi:hypothetical protein